MLQYIWHIVKALPNVLCKYRCHYSSARAGLWDMSKTSIKRCYESLLPEMHRSLKANAEFGEYITSTRYKNASGNAG